MNTKNQRMEDFFDFWRTIIKQNPNFDLNSLNNRDSIYSTLVFFDTKPEDNDTTIVEDGVFDNWVKYYNDIDEVSVLFDENDPCYCYFNNTSKKIYHANDCLILYVPLDHDHIENGVNIIIDYLTQNDIAYIAKVNKKIRSDDVVISLNNPKELEQLCKFIEETPFIQEGLIKPNPFIFHYKNLAISTGNTLSYNSVLALYIKLYIQARKKEDNIDQISNQDFIQFINDYYNNTFVKQCNKDEIITTFALTNNSSFSTEVINIKNITELIIKGNTDGFTFDNLIEHYNKYKDTSFINNELEKTNHNELTEEDIDATNSLLKQALDIMNTKFDKDNAIKRLNDYIFNNSEQLITRDQNLRSKLVNSSLRVNMLYILNNNKVNLSEYLDSLENETLDIENIDIVLNNALKIMSKIYGYDDSIKILDKYIKTNNDKIITRTNNLRNTLLNLNFRKKIIKYLELNNITFIDYVKIISKQSNKEHYLRQAMLATYEKYEQAYNEGTIENNGHLYVESALKQLLCNNSYKGFTRDNGIRTTLSEQVSQDNAIDIIKKALNIENTINKDNINLESANYMVKEYMDLVLSEQKKYSYNK